MTVSAEIEAGRRALCQEIEARVARSRAAWGASRAASQGVAPAFDAGVAQAVLAAAIAALKPKAAIPTPAPLATTTPSLASPKALRSTPPPAVGPHDTVEDVVARIIAA